MTVETSLRCELANFQGFLYAGGMLRNLFDRTDGTVEPCSGIDTTGPICSCWPPSSACASSPNWSSSTVLLDDDELFELVRGDLARRHPKTRSRGRPSTPVEVILRMLVVMRLYGWSYEQAE